MTTLRRWWWFAAVGALGAGVQLASLALLQRISCEHYLLCSAAALELTLIHNSAWHIRFTWRDRGAHSSHLRQIARFHLSSGLVSLVGNLGLMRLLVHTAHLPVLAANMLAIAGCSLINFGLANTWAFASPTVEKGLTRDPRWQSSC